MLNIAEPELKGKAAPRSAVEIERARMTRWLDRVIEEAKQDVVTEVVTLTPVLADLLLSRNDANRKLSEQVVENYRRDMLAGRWAFNGQTIIVSRDGMMNDGQHRCSAVIASGVAIQTVIVFGVARDSRFTVDQGRIRTAGDYLGMNGYVEANVTAAVASYIWQVRERGRISNQTVDRPTKSEVLMTVEHYRNIHDSILVANRQGNALVGGKSVLAFAHWWICRKASEADVSAFILQLIDGNDLQKGNPILTARNRLASKDRLRSNEKVEIIFRAWNAHRRGEKPRTLVALNGLLPKIVGR